MVHNDQYKIMGRRDQSGNVVAQSDALETSRSPDKTTDSVIDRPPVETPSIIDIIAKDLSRGQTLWMTAVSQIQFNTISQLLTTSSPQHTNSTSPSTKIDINTATIEDLVAIPGIGIKKATAIVEYREQHGPFTNIGDVQKVKGIGPKLSKRIAERAK